MKKMFLVLFAALALAFGLGACQSAPTYQQAFQAGCTVVNGDLDAVIQSTFVNDEQKKTLGDLLTANKAVCSAGGQLNLTSLKAVHDSLLPMAITIVEAIPALPQQQAVLLGLRTFGPLVQMQIDMLITAVTPASAPAAASTPLAGAPLQ